MAKCVYFKVLSEMCNTLYIFFRYYDHCNCSLLLAMLDLCVDFNSWERLTPLFKTKCHNTICGYIIIRIKYNWYWVQSILSQHVLIIGWIIQLFLDVNLHAWITQFHFYSIIINNDQIICVHNCCAIGSYVCITNQHTY